MEKYLMKKYGINGKVKVPSVAYLEEELLISEGEAKSIIKRKHGRIHTMLPFSKVCELICAELECL